MGSLHQRPFQQVQSVICLNQQMRGGVQDWFALWIGAFGVPKIVQCDNGKEFKGVLKTLVLQHDILLINGWP